MNTFDSGRFVAWVVWYANQREAKLTPIRIVKFFYLLDLYYAREKAGQTLTGWQWEFVHYGPFAISALNAISEAERRLFIQGTAYQSRFDKETYLYSFIGEDIPEDYPDIFPHYVCSEIKHAVKLWADDTYGLLNHIYFHTEPMMNAAPYQVLDFSIASKPIVEQPIMMLQISKTKVKKARELLSQMKGWQQKAANDQAIPNGPRDDIYQAALGILSEEDLPDFSGILEL